MPKSIRYMMATKAMRGVVDISRVEPDLCIIEGENDACYVGKWVTGLGFFNVHFLKATTRELTAEEVEMYDGMDISHSGVRVPLRVREVQAAYEASKDAIETSMCQ